MTHQKQQTTTFTQMHGLSNTQRGGGPEEPPKHGVTDSLRDIGEASTSSNQLTGNLAMQC